MKVILLAVVLLTAWVFYRIGYNDGREDGWYEGQEDL